LTPVEYFKKRKDRFEHIAQNFSPHSTENPSELTSAMHYMLKTGGKRMRPLLVYAAGECFGAKLEELDPIACCVEFIHTYSLVHDDLPAMDNADFRREKATCHKAFDEATAILAGNALQSAAYDLILQDKSKSYQLRIEMMQTLNHAVGLDGVLGGQMLDIKANPASITLEQIKKIHRLKTAALISASIKLGALASEK
jgi:farnesyl diphosphate synthase